MKLVQLIEAVIGNKRYFAWLSGLDSTYRPFLIYQPTTINQKPITMDLWRLTLLKESTEAIKNGKHHLPKITLLYCRFIKIITKPGTIFQSFAIELKTI